MRNHCHLLEVCRFAAHPRKASAAGLFLCGIMLATQACGGGNSGGGSSGGGNPTPPPPPPAPAFTTIDAPKAGTTKDLGTTAQGINSGGDIAGFFTDAN